MMRDVCEEGGMGVGVEWLLLWGGLVPLQPHVHEEEPSFLLLMRAANAWRREQRGDAYR